VEAAQAAVLVVVGVLLFVAPERTSSLWPWTLTPLTARATAAWLIGVGFVLVTAIGEDDLPRLRVAGVAYVALGVFQAGALARYPEAVDWSSPKLWAFLVVLGSILLVGGYIWARSGPSADVEPPVIGRRLMG
jgi:ABC-type xylose transport system permease subunit